MAYSARNVETRAGQPSTALAEAMLISQGVLPIKLGTPPEKRKELSSSTKSTPPQTKKELSVTKSPSSHIKKELLSKEAAPPQHRRDLRKLSRDDNVNSADFEGHESCDPDKDGKKQKTVRMDSVRLARAFFQEKSQGGNQAGEVKAFTKRPSEVQYETSKIHNDRGHEANKGTRPVQALVTANRPTTEVKAYTQNSGRKIEPQPATGTHGDNTVSWTRPTLDIKPATRPKQEPVIKKETTSWQKPVTQRRTDVPIEEPSKPKDTVSWTRPTINIQPQNREARGPMQNQDKPNVSSPWNRHAAQIQVDKPKTDAGKSLNVKPQTKEVPMQNQDMSNVSVSWQRTVAQTQTDKPKPDAVRSSEPASWRRPDVTMQNMPPQYAQQSQGVCNPSGRIQSNPTPALKQEPPTSAETVLVTRPTITLKPPVNKTPIDIGEVTISIKAPEDTVLWTRPTLSLTPAPNKDYTGSDVRCSDRSAKVQTQQKTNSKPWESNRYPDINVNREATVPQSSKVFSQNDSNVNALFAAQNPIGSQFPARVSDARNREMEKPYIQKTAKAPSQNDPGISIRALAAPVLPVETPFRSDNDDGSVSFSFDIVMDDNSNDANEPYGHREIPEKDTVSWSRPTLDLDAKMLQHQQLDCQEQAMVMARRAQPRQDSVTQIVAAGLFATDSLYVPRKGVVVREVDEGQPCLRCGERCPGFASHQWRNICLNCKCARDVHDVYHDGYVNIWDRLGWEIPEDLHQYSDQDAHSYGYSWVPPGLSMEKIEEYMEQLDNHKIPRLDTDGERYREIQLIHQLPKQDLSEEFCKHLKSNSHQKAFTDFCNSRDTSAMGIGHVKEYIKEESKCARSNCGSVIEAGDMAVFAPKLSDELCWHPACFVCSACDELLVDLHYCHKDGQIFCERHFAELERPRCAACDEVGALFTFLSEVNSGKVLKGFLVQATETGATRIL